MELLIIRHARPIAETRSEGEGSADPPLSPIGVKQAEATAEFLKSQGIQHVVSSTMTRAIQTAEPFSIHTGLKIEMIDDLKEADFDLRIGNLAGPETNRDTRNPGRGTRCHVQ